MTHAKSVKGVDANKSEVAKKTAHLLKYFQTYDVTVQIARWR
jgi:hypothetical protein